MAQYQGSNGKNTWVEINKSGGTKIERRIQISNSALLESYGTPTWRFARSNYISKSTPNMGLIIGATLGGLMVIIGILVAVFYRRRHIDKQIAVPETVQNAEINFFKTSNKKGNITVVERKNEPIRWNL